MLPQTYASPEAFKQAVERRIRTAAGAPGMGRFRQVLVFDRFLARMFEHFGERAIVKGGVVLELRLERARTTRDVDIRLSGSSETLLPELETISTRRSPSAKRTRSPPALPPRPSTGATSSRSRGCLARGTASTRVSCTSPRSSTRTRFRAHGRTHA
jgi:hypothetical protein